jgi:predicted RND superfamily exporter protein
MVSIQDTPNYQAEPLIDAIEDATEAAGGPGVQVTGATVVNTRESSRTIGNLNISLALSVVANLAVIAIAFRSIPIGIISFLPNILPIFAVGTLLFLTGRGMQFTAVLALTVAFGIAVDDTLHFINRYRLLGENPPGLRDRLVETSRRIGPVLVGTTIVIVAGLSTTLTSGLPTAALFGWIAAVTLVVALVGDLIFLPALMASFGHRWFARDAGTKTETGKATA